MPSKARQPLAHALKSFAPLALVVNKLAAQGIGKARDGVFGSTVSGLEWNTPIR
jgi:hypothetical protein